MADAARSLALMWLDPATGVPAAGAGLIAAELPAHAAARIQPTLF